jgi:hypothetical protein
MSASAKPATAEQPEVMAELKTYGIIVSQTPTYEWNGYRYSNARDAIAAAKRGR